jgi:hypothetical protein
VKICVVALRLKGITSARRLIVGQRAGTDRRLALLRRAFGTADTRYQWSLDKWGAADKVCVGPQGKFCKNARA